VTTCGEGPIGLANAVCKFFRARLAEDETGLLRFPPLRAAWSPRGRPKEVLLSGRNARRVVFGAMNLRTGRRLFLPREHQRAADFQAFLRVVHHCYRGWHVALLLDEGPSHTAEGSVQLAAWDGIELLWLPKRCPKLNPMDTLWGQGKDVVSADKQYATTSMPRGATTQVAQPSPRQWLTPWMPSTPSG